MEKHAAQGQTAKEQQNHAENTGLKSQTCSLHLKLVCFVQIEIKRISEVTILAAYFSLQVSDGEGELL